MKYLKKMYQITKIITFVYICLLSCKINAQPILYVENPEYHSYSTSFKCLSVRLTANKTILTHRFKASNGSDGFWVNKGCYLQTYDSPRKYKLLYIKNASFDKYNREKIHDYSDFTQVFEPLPTNCTRFKYYEPDGRYETYDLNNYTGRKIVYSDNKKTYNFIQVADAFSRLFSDNPNVIEVCRNNVSTSPRIDKVEVSLNYPMITLLCRENGGITAYEFRFNINDAQIEEYSIDTGKRFYVINSESAIAYNALQTIFDREDLIIGSHCYKYIYFNSDYPVLNRRIGNALLALIKISKDPNAYVSTDFDKAPSGMSFVNRVRNSKSNATRRTVKKNGTTNRIPTLKKIIIK